MLDRFPNEIASLVLELLGPSDNGQSRPRYTFIHRPRHLMPLALVSRSWRAVVLSVTGEYTSLVRPFESKKLDASSHLSMLKIRQMADSHLKDLESSAYSVRELEIHSCIDLSRCSQFENIRALTILGDTTLLTDTHIPFKHLEFLALAITSKVLTVESTEKIRRLDIVIDSDLTYEALNSIMGPHIEEMNILNRGTTSPLTMEPLITCLSRLPLKRLALRQQTSRFSNGVPGPQVPIEKFYDILNKGTLEELTLSMEYLGSPVMMKYFKKATIRLPLDGERKRLKVTLVECPFTGVWPPIRISQILALFTSLSKVYKVDELKFIYGTQSEIATQTVLFALLDLIKETYNGDEHTFLSTITRVTLMMISNTVEDTQLFLSQQKDPYSTMSYETNSTFSPDYRKLKKYKVVKTANSCLLARDGPDTLDPDFWSGETVLKHLFDYSEKRKSNLW